MAHKIAHPTARTSGLPGAPELNYTPSTPGHFTEGDPVTGEPATVVTMDWLNMVQDEIQNVVEQAGLDLANPNQPDNTQLSRAIPVLSRWNLPVRAIVNYGNTSPQGDHDASPDRGRIIPCDASLGDLRILLPTAASAGNGFALAVVKTDASANNVSIIPHGSDQVQGTHQGFTLVTKDQSVLLASDGVGGWQIIANTQAPPEPVDSWARDNIVLNSWRIAVNGELSRQGMVDGVSDEFEDGSGISTDESVNAYLQNSKLSGKSTSLIKVVALDWQGNRHDYILDDLGGVRPSPGMGTGMYHSSTIYTTATLNGAFKVEYVYGTGNLPDLDRLAIGVVDASAKNDIGVDMWQSQPNAGLVALAIATSSLHQIYSSAHTVITGSMPGTEVMPLSSGDRVRLSRTAEGVIEITRNDILIYTHPHVDLAEKAIIVGADGNNGLTMGLEDISYWSAGSAILNDMDARSKSWQAEQNALTGTGFFLVEAKEAASVNTDFNGYLSNDDGVTWQTLSLARIAEFGDQIMYRGTTQFVTPGRDMRIRFTTANSKDIALHAWSHIWGE